MGKIDRMIKKGYQRMYNQRTGKHYYQKVAVTDKISPSLYKKGFADAKFKSTKGKLMSFTLAMKRAGRGKTVYRDGKKLPCIKYKNVFNGKTMKTCDPLEINQLKESTTAKIKIAKQSHQKELTTARREAYKKHGYKTAYSGCVSKCRCVTNPHKVISHNREIGGKMIKIATFSRKRKACGR